MAKSVATQTISRDCRNRSHESHDSSEGKAVALSRSPRAQGVAFSAAGSDMGRDCYRGMGEVPSHENGPIHDESRACARAEESPGVASFFPRSRLCARVEGSDPPASRPCAPARATPRDHLALFQQVKEMTRAKLKARKSGRVPCEAKRKSDGMPCQAKSEPGSRFCRVHSRPGATR